MKAKAWSLSLFFIAGHIFGAAYVPWRISYDLWMPQIDNQSSVNYSNPKKLPFSSPVFTFAPPPEMSAPPFSADDAFLFEQLWFNAPSRITTSGFAFLLDGDAPVSIPVEAPCEFPQRALAFRTPVSSFVFAPWPSSMTLDDRNAVLGAIKGELMTHTPGEYSVLFQAQ